LKWSNLIGATYISVVAVATAATTTTAPVTAVSCGSTFLNMQGNSGGQQSNCIAAALSNHLFLKSLFRQTTRLLSMKMIKKVMQY